MVVLLLQLTSGLGDVAVFENRQPVTAAKFINKSSLFILLLGVIRRLELKPNSEQKVENIFAPPYCQTASYVYIFNRFRYQEESKFRKNKERKKTVKPHWLLAITT